MASISGAAGRSGVPGLLDKERTMADAGYNRWRVPPAALAIHLCIGMAYGFSVFWLPLSKVIGTACPAQMGWVEQLTVTTCDWPVSLSGFTFTLFIVLLGIAAAVWGGWLERAGPRKAGFIATVCWCCGLAIGALGVYRHQLWLTWLGPGIVGGVGLGLGYISPVSTLIKWFPDRRGMATGMAIMGFGGGAMIGAPLADRLMKYFAAQFGGAGVWETFLALAAVYFVFMLGGAFGYRVPPVGWRPAGWTPPAGSGTAMVTQRHVHVNEAWKTPAFWFVWVVLCMNVSAGIGVLAMASPMLQEVFGGKLLGVDLGINDLSGDQKSQVAAIAAGFTGLLSLFNIMGRFFWASLSDRIGRKATYFVFFVLGLVLYSAVPSFGHAGQVALFVAAFCVILSMYGGGFATVPAYLADLFGTQMVGAIHGRLLTAWSLAGVIGPLLITQLREAVLDAGLAKAQAYDTTMYILAGLLVVGLVANALVRPVAERHFMSDAGLAREREAAHESPAPAVVIGVPARVDAALVLAWLAVGLPILWGAWITLQKALVLF